MPAERCGKARMGSIDQRRHRPAMGIVAPPPGVANRIEEAHAYARALPVRLDDEAAGAGLLQPGRVDIAMYATGSPSMKPT